MFDTNKMSYYSGIKYNDVANGPGVRVSIFLSGCTNHCKNCFNPETWDFEYGKRFTHIEMEEVIKNLKRPEIAGLTILGGDPLHPMNVETTLYIIEVVKAKIDKPIWIYSGYTYEKISVDYVAHIVLMMADVLVDGLFIEELKDLKLKFRGSSNQRIIDLQKSFMSNVVCIED